MFVLKFFPFREELLLLFARTNLHDLRVIHKGKIALPMALNLSAKYLKVRKKAGKRMDSSGSFFTLLVLIFLQMCAGLTLDAQHTFEKSIRVQAGGSNRGVKGFELQDGRLLILATIGSTNASSRYFIWTNADGDTIRSHVFSGSPREIATNGVQLNNELFCIVGYRVDSGGESGNIFVVDSSGASFSNAISGVPGRYERIQDVAVRPDRKLVTAGNVTIPSLNRYYYKSQCRDSLSTLSWSKEWRVRLGRLNAVAIAPDSSQFYTGYLLDYGDTSGSLALMKTDAAGDSLWTRKFFGKGWATGMSILLLNDGLLLGGSTSASSQSEGDAFFVKTNFNGDTLWTRWYGTSFTNEIVNDLAVTSDNCYISCGTSSASLELSKLDTLGNLEWSHDYSGDAEGMSVVSAADSGYVATGSIDLSSGLPSVYLVRTSSNGSILLGTTLLGQKPDEVHVYPNPSNGRFGFMPAVLNDITVRDCQGRLVYSQKSAEGTLDLSALKAGMYLLFGNSLAGNLMEGKIFIY